MSPKFGFQNLDLLAVGIAVAAIGILGFIVFLNNRKSITNRTFFALALIASFYGVVNYLSYQVISPGIALWLLRLVLFSAVWYSIALVHLFYVFPRADVPFPKFYKFVVLPVSIGTAFLTLTPLVFSRITEVAELGQVTNPERGPGIYIFAAVTLLLVVGSLILLFKKTISAPREEKRQFMFVLTGTLITYSALIVFNMIFPVVFNLLQLIPLASIFTFPFIGFTAYAIIRHRLLNVKVITTEILAFALAIITLFEVVIARDLGTLVFRSGTFILVLGFGILLIKSVIREVEQREELERLNKILADQKAKVEELSQFKTQLLSLASHQVKAPLAAIKGFASILLQGLYGKMEPKIHETIEKMKNSSDSLIQLIDTLLSVRQIEEGRMQYSFENVKFKDLVRGVVSELEPLAKGKNLALEVNLASDAMVSADAQKLKQVVQNLVDNAIKYTPQGSVSVELKEDAGWLMLSVKDSGLGINPELLPHLFEEFIREERIKKQVRGTGLGLFIARKIVEAHGGRIWVESDGEGKGSRFYVRLKKV